MSTLHCCSSSSLTRNDKQLSYSVAIRIIKPQIWPPVFFLSLLSQGFTHGAHRHPVVFGLLIHNDENRQVQKLQPIDRSMMINKKKQTGIVLERTLFAPNQNLAIQAGLASLVPCHIIQVSTSCFIAYDTLTQKKSTIEPLEAEHSCSAQ